MAEETADCIERLRRELQGLRESDADLQATLRRALDVLGEMHRARQASATPAKADGAAGSVCSDVSDADTDDSACGSLASPTSELSGAPCTPRGDGAAPSTPSDSASPASARDDHEDARSDSECSVVSTDSGFGRAAGSGQPAASSAPPPPQRFQRNLRRAQLPERWKRAVERKRAERKLTAARSLPSLCHEDGSPVPPQQQQQLQQEQQQQEQQPEEPEREDWTEALLSGSRTRQPLVLGDNSFADLVHNWMDLPDICNGGTARAAQTQQQQQQNPKLEKESKRPTGLARLLSIPEQIRKRFSSSSSSSGGLSSRADKSRTVKKTRHLSIYELDDMDSFFDELPPHGARPLGQRHSHPCMVGSLSQPDVCSFVGSHLEDARRLSSHFRSVVWV
ncbi:uncharacterized protein LOC116952236 isoform X1 [Petromyzon marinus]|uniref:uncharacterized protein LOC116952236 isoform X1 n=2 Tax=Petromyzon marinus TaxID=7757 RepID=UPI003F7302A4